MSVGSDELVSLDVLGSDHELQVVARDASSRVGVDGEVEGRDATRAVVVRIDRRGRVSDVLISAWWRDDLTPSGLQEAVLSAYRAALVQAAAAIDPAAARDEVSTPLLQVAEGSVDDGDRAGSTTCDDASTARRRGWPPPAGC